MQQVEMTIKFTKEGHIIDVELSPLTVDQSIEPFFKHFVELFHDEIGKKLDALFGESQAYIKKRSELN